jgi:tRNA(Phe) wybutosine-synthesizing methylase Tyw3
MDTVVAAEGEWLVSPEYLRFAVGLARTKMQANLRKLAQLERQVRLRLQMMVGGEFTGTRRSHLCLMRPNTTEIYLRHTPVLITKC